MSALFQLATSWEVKPMGELCSGDDASIQTGPFGSQLHASDYVEDGIPCVMPQDIRDGRVSIDSIARISDEDHRRLYRFHLREGDIVYPRRGNISKRALIRKREAGWLCGTGCLRIRPNTSTTDPKFLAYYLSHPDVCAWIEGNAVGATMPHLNTGLAGSIPVVCPPLAEQREIASLLGALDDKIELNRKMAATLEEMARTLYRSWFVDFDPVHAKAQGRAPAHMDHANAALFPDNFGPDGLPEGWAMKSIYDFARVQYGAAFKSALFNTYGEGRPLVRIRDLKNHSAGVHTTETHKKEHLIQPGDTVVGMDGDFTAYSWCNAPALMNQRVCSFLPKSAGNRSFVRHGIVPLLKAEEEAAVATTVIHLGKKDIDTFLLPDAGSEVLQAFSSMVEPMTERITQLGLESITLAALRDTLLPRLMSGAIRIREAEKQVEEVA